ERTESLERSTKQGCWFYGSAEGQPENNLSTSSLPPHVRTIPGAECHTNKEQSVHRVPRWGILPM
ncbi:hypothetical protein WUBG_17794, partial [Wuchereria bancrofti]